MNFLQEFNFMEMINPYLPYITYVGIAIVVFAVLKLFHIKIRTIIKVLINILVGGAILFAINLIPSIAIPIDIWRALAVGIFGIPAVIVIVVLYFIK